ncbi:hypothetical protein [Rhodococcus sp. B10]|uniref:hypothetical protein n=1 Tax=Rhodococcus sp. B10 TaxID=2695876 RepID=UPI00142F442E|nr:hypothetical protein [Rhodococcus sp. B10]NIL78399.1 hypothetical protein [Rhodococcus sp. B10]
MTAGDTDAARTLGLTPEDARRLDPQAIDDLLVGRVLDDDIRSGARLHDAAFAAGYTDSAARTLLHRYRQFVEDCNQRDQIALF